MKITHKLSLNKHPRACDNLSLITAQNIKIDRDNTCLTNEESIRENTVIKDGLTEYFDGGTYDIVGWIPCSNEIVLFVKGTKYNENKELTDATLIVRYTEESDDSNNGKLWIDRAYKNWIYSGGKIKGSFTYNVEGSLVIIFSEYEDTNENDLWIPIKTINMGVLENTNNINKIEDDLELPDILTPCNPEVRLPICKNLTYTKGKTYKGIYHLYIRFKINTVDYTQWFPIGFPIYIDELQQQNIMKYHYNRYKNVDFDDLIKWLVGNQDKKSAPFGYVVGCSDSFAIDNEFANYTFSVILQFQAQTFDVVKYYKNIQIAWICVTKEDSKAYRTNDLAINYEEKYEEDNDGNKKLLDYEYQFESKFESLIESTVEEITPQYQNYFNVKNIVNYKNKIYIANYEELNLNQTNFNDCVDEINTELGIQNHITEDNGYNFSMFTINAYAHATAPYTNTGGKKARYMSRTNGASVQRYTGTNRYISLDKYLGINEDVRISVYQVQDYKTNYNESTASYKTDKASNFGLYICAQKKSSATLRGYPFGVVNVYQYNEEYKALLPIRDNLRNADAYKYSIYVKLQDSDERIYITHSFEDNDSGGPKTQSMSIAYGETPYIDVNSSFNERCQHATLIPGEVYNFYIHYVDKYGNVSNGYQIQNKIKWLNKTGDEVVPVGINVKYGSENEEKTRYYLVDYNENVYDTLDRLAKEYNDDNDAKITLLNTLPDLVDNEYRASEFDNAYISVKMSLFINAYHTFYNEKYKDVKWYQIALLPEDSFFPFENTDGKRLFKVPSPKVNWGMDGYTTVDSLNNLSFGFKNKSIYTQYHPIFKNIKLPNDKYCGFFFSYEKIEKQIITTGLLTQSDFMSQNYIYNSQYSTTETHSYKFHMHRKFVRNNANAVYSSYMCFYSSYFDMNELDDKMDINMIRIEGKNVFKEEDIIPTQYMQQGNGFNFLFDQNKPQIYASSHIMSLGIDEYIWCKANDEKNNRYALGTCLKINTIEELFDHTNDGGYSSGSEPDYRIAFYSYKGEQADAKDSASGGRLKYAYWSPRAWRKSNNNLYKASLLNISRAIYTNDVKELIRMSDVKYLTEGTYCKKASIIRGLNGRNTIESFLVYNNNGFYLNSGEDGKNEVVTLQGVNMYYPTRPVRWWKDHDDNDDYKQSLYSYVNECPFCAYLQMPTVQNYMHESKQFKSPPTDYSFLTYYHDDTTEYDYYNAGCLVEPVNSVDLFENKQSTFDDNRPTTYTNYDENLVASSVFNRTIRRSNVIQDETRLNGWRKFDLEDYKVITENKGDITYLFGRNKVLFIHTQHSLFMLNAENTLKTEDKSVDLTSQDVFDVTYSEVVSSELGYAGLQDMYSCCYDQFGYIFYDQDNQRIYLLDNKTVSPIDDDIVEWLHKYKPTKVRFGHDRENNRVLIKMNYCPPVGENELEIVLSYNYISKTFVSLHSYHFDDAFSTKTKLYLFCNAIPSNNSDNNLHTNCSLHNFVQNGESYCSFDNVLGNKGEAVIMPSKIGIIYNSNYSDIKYLNSITYKLNKKDDCQEVDYTNIFEELHEVPFAGDILKVYNNIFSTGELNIAIDNEEEKNRMLEKDMPYLKPYWELGNWNFSFIRDKGEQYSKFWKKISENYISPDNMARMAGNFFVIEFLFDNEKNNQHKIEFEDLDCDTTKR